MSMRSFFVALLALLLGALVVPSGPATAQSVDEVFERLKTKYESIDALRADFAQTMRSSYMDDEATSSGVLIASGEKYRVETDGQTLVTDGIVTWVFMRSQDQVLINDYSEDEQSFSVSEFLFDYDEKFDATSVQTTTVDGEEHFVLTLEPESEEAFFTEATLSMRTRDDIITRLQVVDVNGTTMDFNLTNIELNPALDSTVFQFTPPNGAEVIDLRS
ncbi:MAG: outer membrane lipoprotein carrier protein LolA [Rhodothermales bacterium]